MKQSFSLSYNTKIENTDADVQASVIIVNYNGSVFLQELLKSLANQTFTDFEVIFVDNHSSDNSLTILNRFIKERCNLNFKIIKNIKNFGYCQGNNIGLFAATGKYIVFLNNDTFVSKNWLKELVTVMKSHPNIGACQSRLITPDTDRIQNDGHLLDIYGWSQGILLGNENMEVSTSPVFVSGAAFIARREDLLEIGGFDPDLYLGDYDLCLRLRLLGYRMGVALRSICYHYGGITISNLTIAPRLKTAYHFEKERPRVLLKVYTFTHIISRIPVLLLLMLAESLVRCVKYKTPYFISGFIEAMIWNLSKFKGTLIHRHRIQNTRLVSDSQIEQQMPRYIIVLSGRWTVKV